MNGRFSGEIVYHSPPPLPCAPMLEFRTPLLRLDRLRRSVRLAVLVLAVFVLRIGMVAACIPSDLAELAQDAGHIETAAHSGDAPADVESAHTEGHCLHCSCHHAVTLPAALATLPAVRVAFVGVSPVDLRTTAPPDLSLRPPIR